MTDDFKLYVGIDWATEEHEVCALDADGKKVAARSFKHRRIGDPSGTSERPGEAGRRGMGNLNT